MQDTLEAAMKLKSIKQQEEKIPSLSCKEALVLDLLLNKPSAGMYGLQLVKHVRQPAQAWNRVRHAEPYGRKGLC